MNKTIKYGTNGALIGGLGNALLNAFNQLNNQDEYTPFDWNELLNAFGKGALLGGLCGLTIGAIRDENMSNVLIATGGTTGFIKDALNNYSDTNILLSKKAEKIQSKLYNNFKENLSEYPSLNGSIVKGTAIQNSDIDIQLKFNRNSEKVGNIRNIVENYLNENINDKTLLKVRSQNHSIGLVFNIQGEEKRIDVVPMREVENGKGDTYLYSTKNNGIKKTNSQKQIISLKFTEKQKQIIKLLKGWKINNGLQLPSILIEYIVKRAFDKYNIPNKIDKALLFVIEYIANNIISLRVIDPANTNNIISDSLTYNQKVFLQNFCSEMLDEIKEDKRNIIDYFKTDNIFA